MKRFKNTFFGILLFLVAAVLLLYVFDYEYILKGISTTYLSGHTTAYIEDYTEFPNREIEAGEPQEWPLHHGYNSVSATERLQQTNKELGTVAFLIIKNDSIWYENYAEGYDKDSRTNSFSMAKSIVAALLGKAIAEGKISGLDQPVSDFFPQFDSRLTVGDLASMSSGLNWEENYYNPFSMTARAYFGDNIEEQILSLKVVEEPGQEFNYLSGNTELLGMVIAKATGKTLSQYLSESFWKPLGMHKDALWQIDNPENGMEKAYCCIASNARDFAKFGKLYKDFGNWKGQQLLDSSFVATSIHPRFEDYPDYGYGLWLEDYKGKDIFYLRGILGQYVIVIPEDDLIIVRLGKDRGKRPDDQQHSNDFYTYLDEVYNMLGNPL
ncbi:serine hydrolase domain-containing protein [Salinimicrobium soli]|uniref:serine hydrolase domain-containing protein n=1 Tax=Salinimicrobium soli TaxID=1254399 RepID=UPI003AADC46F